MNGKRGIAALAVALVLLAGAGSALATGKVGPAKARTGYGLHQAGPGMMGGGYGMMGGGVVITAAADYIGVTPQALAAERRQGASLAELAVAHGKTEAGLQQALVAAFQKHADAMVTAGLLTADRAKQAVATFQSRVQALVESSAAGPAAGGAGGMCGGMRGWHGGGPAGLDY
jgi:hypothetical protein